jgi:hypothetical protein
VLQDAFGAQFKAFQGTHEATDEEQEGGADVPQDLEKHTEHGFWTASPIWSSESASSGELSPFLPANSLPIHMNSPCLTITDHESSLQLASVIFVAFLSSISRVCMLLRRSLVPADTEPKFLFGCAVRRGIEVARVLLHRTAGIAALQWRPTSRFAAEGVPIDALSASDALAAKQLMRATLLGVEETVHPSPAVVPAHAPMHTNFAFWALLSGG